MTPQQRPYHQPPSVVLRALDAAITALDTITDPFIPEANIEPGSYYVGHLFYGPECSARNTQEALRDIDTGAWESGVDVLWWVEPQAD